MTRGALELAPRLIGCVLLRETAQGRRAGIIVETEAYPGGADEASHTRRGLRTPRNEVMWREGGCAYVYFTYGMHWMCNVVSGAEGAGEAVLIRALEPIEGLDLMRRARPGSSDRDLCRGPARLARALEIDGALNGCRLLDREATLRLEPPPSGRSRPIARAPRVGVDFAGPWARKPWRFLVAESPFVSRLWRSTSSRR